MPPAPSERDFDEELLVSIGCVIRAHQSVCEWRRNLSWVDCSWSRHPLGTLSSGNKWIGKLKRLSSADIRSRPGSRLFQSLSYELLIQAIHWTDTLRQLCAVLIRQLKRVLAVIVEAEHLDFRSI